MAPANWWAPPGFWIQNLPLDIDWEVSFVGVVIDFVIISDCIYYLAVSELPNVIQHISNNPLWLLTLMNNTLEDVQQT